jgi:hydroxyacylglutathione hydrolase
VTARIDYTVTSGTFSLDGETFDVENNVWIVGDDAECVIIDAPHDVAAITRLVGERTVRAVVCTHAHDDHVRVAPALGAAVGAPVLLHPDDLPLWRLTHDTPPDGELSDGQQIEVAGISLEVIHTPGHAPGAVCLYARDLAVVFTGTPSSTAARAPPVVASATSPCCFAASPIG